MRDEYFRLRFGDDVIGSSAVPSKKDTPTFSLSASPRPDLATAPRDIFPVDTSAFPALPAVVAPENPSMATGGNQVAEEDNTAKYVVGGGILAAIVYLFTR